MAALMGVRSPAGLSGLVLRAARLYKIFDNSISYGTSTMIARHVDRLMLRTEE
jgi:hypothetical protein